MCRTRAMRLLDNASKSKPFEHCSIISFAKLDITWNHALPPYYYCGGRRALFFVSPILPECFTERNENRAWSQVKLDTTISTHSTNIRSAVQKSCCSCTYSITALHSAQFHFASLFCPHWPLQFRPSWLAWGFRSFGSPHHDNIS